MEDCNFPGMHCSAVTEWDPTAYIAAGMIIIIGILIVKKIATILKK